MKIAGDLSRIQNGFFLLNFFIFVEYCQVPNSDFSQWWNNNNINVQLSFHTPKLSQKVELLLSNKTDVVQIFKNISNLVR